MMKKAIHILFAVLLVISTFAPAVSSAAPYYNSPYRHEIGLNVHWALSGFGKDYHYNERMFESKTKWVREHFSTEVFNVDRPEAWFERYDEIMSYYRAHDIKVVGMLAYGFENGEFGIDDEERWIQHIDTIVNRYKDDVEVWEVWNEPDSPDYLSHNSPENFVSILKPAYTAIKSADSSAKVIAGGLAQPNLDFTRAIFEQAEGYFDIFGVHYYYGEKYVADGDLQQLDTDAKALRELVSSYDPTMPIWVTEMGLSTAAWNISEETQKEYLQKSTAHLLQNGYTNRIFLYNFRNYDYNTAYENNFGLVDNDIQPRASWQWYLEIPRGPYDVVRLPIAAEQQRAVELKNELETYFGKGLIPISEENWPTVVQAYVYGGYSVQAIVQSIRFGGKTVHPRYSAKFWKMTADYENYINKDWTGGLITYAYDNPRIKVTDEAKKAQELRTALETHHDFSKLNITPDIWGDLVKAYVYGGYPVSAVARASVTNWKTVSKSEHYNTWKNSVDFQEGIQYKL